MQSAAERSNGTALAENASRIPTCRHCAAEMDSNSETFCCKGCETAYRIINQFRVAEIYSGDGETKLTNSPLFQGAKPRFSHFDDIEFYSRFVRALSSTNNRVIFQSPGIHCAACVWLLEKLPETIEGILQVRADLTRAQVTITFNRGEIRLSEIGQILSRLGYDPHPLAIDPSERQTNNHDKLFSLRLGVAAFCAMNVMLLFIGRYQGLFSGMERSYEIFFAWVSLALSLPAVLFAAQPFYQTSLAGLKRGRLHIDLPISIAIVGGFIASAINTILGRSEIYFDTVTALVFLLLLGRWFQRKGMKEVASAASMLYALAPISAKRINESGAIEEVFVASLRIDDTVVVAHNERVPADGELLSENVLINESLITGESTPRGKISGQKVYCGSINAGSEFLLKVTATAPNSRIGALLNEIELTPSSENEIVKFTDLIAKYFVWGVLGLAAVTFFALINTGIWHALDRVFALLIVSCPCALGIATPIVLSLATSRAARSGILLRSGTALEQLARTNRVVFDKTGTLTKGVVEIDQTVTFNSSRTDEMWETIAALTQDAEHPYSRALSDHALARKAKIKTKLDIVLIPGCGVEGRTSTGEIWRLGSIKWLEKVGVEVAPYHSSSLFEASSRSPRVALAVDKNLAAVFTLRDLPRPEALEVIQRLRENGIQSSIVSGDATPVVEEMAAMLKIPRKQAIGEMTPEEKGQFISTCGTNTVFVGDGVNDTLALSSAGIGIGINGGAEVCLKVSDVYLVKPDLNLLITLIDGAHSAMSLIRRHLAISLFYNISAASLAVTGHISPLAAALIMPASSLTVILSSLWNAPFKGGERWK